MVSITFYKNSIYSFYFRKCQKLTLGDQQPTGSFEDVKTLYEAERESILKTTPLTYASVFPSKLQLQSVQHVLKVFNEKVVAGLKIQGSNETAAFIHGVLNWWNTVNVIKKSRCSIQRSIQVSRGSKIPRFWNDKI